MKEIEGINLTITSPAIYDVVIQGSDAILFNKMPDMSQAKTKGPKQQQVDRLEDEKANFREKAYLTSDNKVYIPSENMHESLCQGAQYWGQKIPGAGSKTFTDVVKSACVVEDVDLGATKDDLIAFGKAVNGTPTKKNPSKVYKVRPLLRPWAGRFRIHVFDARIDASILKTIVAYAGAYRGVCEWRPKFGRFEVISVTEVTK